jgi:transposase
MAKGYRPVRRDQPFLLPPDMREWLPGDHPVHLVIRAVERMDIGAFHARRRTGGAGAAGYDPAMLVTLLVWAYAQGVASSRRMGSLCGTDVAFRVVCGGNLPDHVTIARFRADFADAVTVLFSEVLILCAAGHGEAGHGRAGRDQGEGERVEDSGPDRGPAGQDGRGAGRGARGDGVQEKRDAGGRIGAIGIPWSD